MQNPKKPTKYTGPDEYYCPSVNVPARYSDPTSGDYKDPLTGGIYKVCSIWLNQTTNSPWMFGSNKTWFQLQKAPITTGSAPTKGTVTLAAGTTLPIATTAVTSGSTIVYTITALGTVSEPQAMYFTIVDGTSFTITSADATDTSTLTWQIVG